jgi:hypothetical protein
MLSRCCFDLHVRKTGTGFKKTYHDTSAAIMVECATARQFGGLQGQGTKSQSRFRYVQSRASSIYWSGGPVPRVTEHTALLVEVHGKPCINMRPHVIYLHILLPVFLFFSFVNLHMMAPLNTQAALSCIQRSRHSE